MAKTTGLGDNFYIAGVDLSGDVSDIKQVGGGPAALDITGINKSAHERIGGLRNGQIQFTSWFNPGLLAEHVTLAPLPTTDVIMSYRIGTAIGNPVACLVAKQVDYQAKRANNGALTFDVNAMANGFGLEWGAQGTAGKRTDTTATNGAAIDFGVGSTTFGLQAYLHVFDFTGTSVTINLRHSTDNGGSDAFASITGATFTAATGVTSERIATANNATIKRYVQVSSNGTFSSATFAVAVVRNDTAVVF